MFDSTQPCPYVRASFSYASADQMDQASAFCSIIAHKERKKPLHLSE